MLCREVFEGEAGLAEVTRRHKDAGGLDCGHHFVINSGGDVELGRADHLTGWHTPGFNSLSVSVAVVCSSKHQALPLDHPILEALRVKYPEAEVIDQEDLVK